MRVAPSRNHVLQRSPAIRLKGMARLPHLPAAGPLEKRNTSAFETGASVGVELGQILTK
jgi:hypothetical protein